MKKCLLLAFVCAGPVLAETVIYYGDGSQYTIENTEEIYVTKRDVWSLTGSTSSAAFRMYKLDPNTKRDYFVEEPTGDEACWPWAGIAPPPGYSLDACQTEEQEGESCDGLGFGHGDC